MNAINYLMNDHRSHRARLDEIETNRDAFFAFRDEFIHHVNVEEAILYPNLLTMPEFESYVRRAWEEHSICMQLVQELDDVTIGSQAWNAKFSILKKLVLEHLKEEEDELFPRIKELSSEEFLQEVGDQMLIQEVTTPTEEIIYPEEPGSHVL